jgi:hypothetical protein
LPIVNPESAVFDHDHQHCPGGSSTQNGSGCEVCRRGLLHRTCNTAEGYIRRAVELGILDGVSGRLLEYLNDPPYQRWVRERDAAKDIPLAA